MQRDDDDERNVSNNNNNQHNNNRKYLAIMVIIQLFLYMYFQIRQQQEQHKHLISSSSSSESKSTNGVSPTSLFGQIGTNHYFYSSRMNKWVANVAKDPRERTLLKIAAHIYFLPLKRYVYNLIGDEDDPFEKTTQYIRFSQFLYPDLEHLMGVGNEKFDSQSHDEFDFFRSPPSDDIIYEKPVTRCDIEIFISKSCLRTKIPQEKTENKDELQANMNEKLKNLRDAYLKETLQGMCDCKLLQ